MPIWADFDSEISQNDPRPGAENSRYYGQAEIEGLPDLVNFIFRTVMLVTGRVEGISADRMKRVNASIPKGYGEPLEVAKTFALWVAWKRGNEDPPAWAHPDAILPSSKEEGPPKKLSERKLKELERKEAIAAWRIAPDRQSARVMTKKCECRCSCFERHLGPRQFITSAGATAIPSNFDSLLFKSTVCAFSDVTGCAAGCFRHVGYAKHTSQHAKDICSRSEACRVRCLP